jgi:hypothetical protein
MVVKYEEWHFGTLRSTVRIPVSASEEATCSFSLFFVLVFFLLLVYVCGSLSVKDRVRNQAIFLLFFLFFLLLLVLLLFYFFFHFPSPIFLFMSCFLLSASEPQILLYTGLPTLLPMYAHHSSFT